MKTTLQSFFCAKAISAFVIYATLLFCSVTAFGQITTVFSDNFNRASINTGVNNYTLTPSSANATILTVASDATDYRVQIKNGIATSAPASAGADVVMNSYTAVAPTFNTKLSSNSKLVSWSFNMKHNKQSGSTLSGFDLALGYGVATIIACDNINPLDPTAKGYAVVMGGDLLADAAVNNSITYNLVSFTGGLIANTNITTIIQGITLASYKDVVSIKVTYDPLTNKWNMFQKDEYTIVPNAAFANPSAISVAAIGEVLDTADFVKGSLPNFGLVFNHKTENNNSFYFDNFKVILGSVPSTNFYLVAKDADCSATSNWWSNNNGTGNHPSDFISPNQNFNILNASIIGSNWTVSGDGSKVILGSYPLIISATAPLNGKIDLLSGSILTIEHLTVSPSLNIIDPNSTLVYNGADAQSVQSATYGNLSILTKGLGATALGTISIRGNLNIADGSILSMSTNKIATIGTLSGIGSLKTKFAFSGALPAGLTWPYDVFYNYTSVNTAQTIVAGTYKNLDIDGGPRNLPNDFSVSGTFNPGTFTLSGANIITFNGTGPQLLKTNFPPAYSIIIANTGATGVSLTASDTILDTTILQLDGTLSSGGFNETFGSLALSNNSILNLGSGLHIIAFANSSSEFWILDKTITIKGWTGTPGATGSGGKVFVGADATGLTADQLKQIKFEGYTGATILATGEVVPTASLGTPKQDFVNFKYYPNPVVGSITLSHAAPITKVAVYNLAGQKVLTSNPNTASTKLDMSELSPSTYFIELTSEGKKGTVKVIKN